LAFIYTCSEFDAGAWFEELDDCDEAEVYAIYWVCDESESNSDSISSSVV